MSVELRRLIEKVKHMDITLAAGQGGEDHQVSWVHMVETVEASKFLEGGEIAIVTGIGLNTGEGLFELVQCIQDRNASAVIVNIGPFVEEIDERTLNFCNRMDFPLYVVPWKIHLAEIIRIFCYTITKSDQRNIELAAGFKNAILFPKQEELYVVPLSQRNYNVNWRYSVGVMRVEGINGFSKDRMDNLIGYMENYLRHYYENYVIFPNDMEIVIVAANMNDEVHKQFIHKLRERAAMYLREDETMTMGVGRMTKSIRCVYKSYNQAHAIQRLQLRGKIDADTIFYTDLGVYRLLMGIEDPEIVSEYYESTLGPLVEHDANKGTELCEVLQCYLKHDGSVRDTAEELFVHRNTINYKLNKIEELLGVDLSSLNTRLELMIAFILKDVLK